MRSHPQGPDRRASAWSVENLRACAHTSEQLGKQEQQSPKSGAQERNGIVGHVPSAGYINSGSTTQGKRNLHPAYGEVETGAQLLFSCPQFTSIHAEYFGAWEELGEASWKKVGEGDVAAYVEGTEEVFGHLYGTLTGR